MSNISERKLAEVIRFLKDHSKEETREVFNLEKDTLRKYLYKARKLGMSIEGKSIYKSAILDKIVERFTDDELRAIAEGGRLLPGAEKIPIINFEGERIRFTLAGDLHLGSLFTNEERVYKMFEESHKEGCEFIALGGDVTEGMSNRPGHIYELSHLGYDQQKEYSVKILGQWDRDMFMIDGNHDRWFIKSNGAIIVKDICEKLGKRFTFLGHDEGDISLKGKATLKLWHGEDGNSYAISYRVQKIIESITGGEKPNILSCHHVHKVNYILERNVHAISPGCLQSQTPWMRGKRIAAHVAFVIVDAWINKSGVAKLKFEIYPFYV